VRLGGARGGKKSEKEVKKRRKTGGSRWLTNPKKLKKSVFSITAKDLIYLLRPLAERGHDEQHKKKKSPGH